MKKKLTIFVTIIAFLIVTWVFIVPQVALSFIRNEIESNCKSCELEMKSAIVYPFGGAEVEGITGKVKQNESVHFEFKINRAKLAFSIFDILQSKMIIDHVLINGLNLKVFENHTSKVKKLLAKNPDSMSKKEFFEKLPGFYVKIADIEESEVSYIHQVDYGDGMMTFKNVIGKMENLSTRNHYYEDVTQLGLRGNVENSGSFEINIKAELLKDDNHDELNVALLEHDLSKSNRFFKAEEGILLKGDLLSSKVQAKINKGHLSGSMTARFKNVQISVIDDARRSGIEAFFANIASALTISDSNIDEKEDFKTVRIQTIRTKDQSIFNFILSAVVPGLMSLLKQSR